MTRDDYLNMDGFDPVNMNRSVSDIMGVKQGFFGFLNKDGKVWAVCQDLANNKINTFEISYADRVAIVAFAKGYITGEETGLSVDQVEMLMTGINPDDWNKLFPPED